LGNSRYRYFHIIWCPWWWKPTGWRWHHEIERRLQRALSSESHCVILASANQQPDYVPRDYT